MRTDRTKRLVTAALASAMLVVVGAAGPAWADEPAPPVEAPPSSVPAEPAPIEEVPADPAVGEVDGVPVAVAQAPVPPPVQVAQVAVPAERVATAVVDGVEVGLVDAPVPPATTEPVPVEPPVTNVPAARAPEYVPGPAVAEVATVALVLAAWG
jgi:hypothetical protein